MKIILFGFFFIYSCSTMRLSINSPYTSSSGNGSLVYERSYFVGGGMPLWCGLTVIFYGGACWAYLAMPFLPQQEKFLSDATHELNQKLGATDSEILSDAVERISWGSADPYMAIAPQKNEHR